MQILFIVPRIVIVAIDFASSVLSIIKETLTFLIKQIELEVLKITYYGKSNEKSEEKGTEVT